MLEGPEMGSDFIQPDKSGLFLIKLFQFYNVGNINFQHFDAGRNPYDISGNGWKISPCPGKLSGSFFHHFNFGVDLV